MAKLFHLVRKGRQTPTADATTLFLVLVVLMRGGGVDQLQHTIIMLCVLFLETRMNVSSRCESVPRPLQGGGVLSCKLQFNSILDSFFRLPTYAVYDLF
jgi:hypothetical protein